MWSRASAAGGYAVNPPSTAEGSDDYPYGYYRPAPFVSFGIGPFGFVF